VGSVAGIDRWRGGWVIAEDCGDELRLSTAAHIDEVTDHLASCVAVAIDMPIALAVSGRRAAEGELRALLGSSARSVFTSPTRAGVEALSQAEATVINRQHGGPGISAQAFGLFASIRELRAHLGSPATEHWHETHPESSFAAMNGGVPLAAKRSARGVAERLAHLRNFFPTVDASLLGAPERVPIDDVLDAIAAAWSAKRIAEGTATLFGEPGRDDQGFPHGIRI